MLLGKDGGRHEEGDLLAIVDRLEGGAHGDFSLAVADIATDEAIHRPVGLHVALDGIDRMQLVLGFLVRERALHLLLPRAVRAVNIPLDQLAFGVELEQVVGDLGDGALGALLDGLPVRRAQAVDRRRDVARSHVAAEAIGLVHGHVELVSARVGDEQVFARDAAQFHVGESLELADAVLDVHDKVAGLDVGEEKFGRHLAVLLGPGACLRLAPAEEFGVGEEV